MNTTKDKLKLCHTEKTFSKACISSSAKSTIKYAGHQVRCHFLNTLSSSSFVLILNKIETHNLVSHIGSDTQNV